MKTSTKKVASADEKSVDKRQVEGQDARVVILYTVKIGPPEYMMGDYLEAIITHGGLFEQAKAARVAGVSRARINQLVLSGRLPLIDVQLAVAGKVVPFEQLIPADALLAWMKEPRAAGRPRKSSVEEPALQAA